MLQRGHYDSECHTRGIAPSVHQVQVREDSPCNDDVFLGAVRSRKSSASRWTVTLLVNLTCVEFQIDTGAKVTVIPAGTYKQLGSPALQPAKRNLKGPNSSSLRVRGQFSGKLTKDHQEVEQEIYVVDDLFTPLLGQPAIEALGLIRRVAGVQAKTDKQNLTQQFPKLFTGLGKLEGEYSIQLKDKVKPYALSVPIPLMDAVKEELERMEKLEVISKVTEPTDWCSGLVVVPKKNKKVRICVDLTNLNESVKRERHPLPPVEQTLARVAGAKVFSKLDANSGFWQIPLSAKSIPLTTFITPFGRFCFNRLPFGITSAPEHFQRRIGEILEGFEGFVNMMDDTLVYGRTQEEHDERLFKILQRIQDANLTLNLEKCQFSKSSIEFLGQVIDGSGIRPDPEKIAAIVDMPTPTNVGDIRRFLGVVNQMGKFVSNLAEKSQPLRELLVKDNQWVWNDPQRRAFEQIKQALTSSPILALFDINYDTVVSADASHYGLGAVMSQKQPDGQFKPVAFISRSMSSAETRYAQIEKEALAFTWACERLEDYLVGLPFHILTDHKPLVPLFSTKRLDELPLRVQRFRLRMMRYDFTISHVPGKDLVFADALSRAPAREPTETDQSLVREADAYVNIIMNNLPATEKRLEEIRNVQGSDKVCKQIMRFCQSGWPRKRSLTLEIRPYHTVSSELCIEDGLLMRAGRIVIPSAMRSEVLKQIHTGHQGIHKCRERARQSVWWPKLSKDLEEMVKRCQECSRAQNQRSQPLIPSELPDLPWQKVGTDLFEWRKAHYLLIVDYYSRYIEIAKLKGTTSEEVILHTKSIFARHGIPEVVISDNGPQFSAENYTRFATEYHFQHITSSPYYPQSNGEAERAVGTIKSLLNKEQDPYLAVLAYRSTPLRIGYSPSELLMGRKLRSTVPLSRSQRQPQLPDAEAVRLQDNKIKEKQKKDFDRHHNVRDLPDLSPGDSVWVPSRDTEGVISDEVAPRSYVVTTPTGVTRRNRRSLIRTPVTTLEEAGDEEEESSSPPPLESSQPDTPPPNVPVRRSCRQANFPDYYGWD